MAAEREAESVAERALDVPTGILITILNTTISFYATFGIFKRPFYHINASIDVKRADFFDENKPTKKSRNF